MRYDALAPIYDRLMSHVEYDEWLGLIERVVKKFSTTKKPSILELGGGTGVLGQMLVRKGFNYQGSDYCFSMCREALQRELPVVCADARHLPFKSKFDLIIFLYDGINYLQAIDDYEALFSEVAIILNPGGLFLFDITTETNSLAHFTDFLDFEDYGDYSYVRHSYYDEETTTQFNDFTIYRLVPRKNGLYEKFTERHEQKVFPVKYIEEAVPHSQLATLGIWDGYTFRRYSSKSERIHFLLQKKARR